MLGNEQLVENALTLLDATDRALGIAELAIKQRNEAHEALMLCIEHFNDRDSIPKLIAAMEATIDVLKR